MRHFLKAGNESFYQSDLNISCEEADVLADEAVVDLAEADGDLQTAERLVDVSDAMEDMAAIVDGVEEPSDTERNLVEVAGDMAVAGTDAVPEDVMVPATESFGRPGMESLATRAKQIWDKVLAMLKKIWEKIEGFFYKIFGAVPSKRRTLKSLRSAVEAASSRTMDKDGKKFKVSSTKGLTVDNTGVKTGAAFKTAVDHTVASVKWGLEAYASALAKAGDKLATAVEDFEVEKASEFANNVKKSLQLVPDVPGSKKESSERYSGMDAAVGHALLGNQSLVYRFPKETGKSGVLHMLELARRSCCVLAPTNIKKNTVPDSIEFETLGVGVMESLLDAAETILDTIEEFSRGQKAKDISTSRKKIETASGKASTAWDKHVGDKDNKVSDDDKALLKSALNFNLAYANWAKEPISGLIQHGLHVTSTIFALVSKSASMYK